MQLHWRRGAMRASGLRKTPWPMRFVMKLFTVQEANSLLPSIRPIVNSIRRSHRRLRSYQRAAKHAAAGAETGGGGMERGPQYARLLIDLSLGAGKLESLGLQVKDYAQGLIDFPS